MILEAGRVSPNAVNYQPQQILVLNSEEDLAKLELFIPFRFQHTLALLICYDENINWKRTFDNKDSGDINESIVATHMMLSSTNLGIGSTWVRHFNPQAIREIFNVPANIIPVALLLLGYSTDHASPHIYHNKCLEISETTFYGSF